MVRWPWESEPAAGGPAVGAAPPGPASALPGNGSLPPGRVASARAPEFIGRTAEQELFRGLLGTVAGGGSAFVHLTGTPRSGRRALLKRFRVLAAAAAVRCSPVVDLQQDAALELDELLERIAAALEPAPEHFKPFFEATKRLRSRAAGQASRTAQAVAVVRAGSSAVAQLAGTLPVKAVNAAIQSPIGDVLTEHAETRRTLSAVGEEFVKGLLELADAGGPVLLAFSDLDFDASSAKLLWLRRSLLPRIARARVIVAVSTEPMFELGDVGPLFGRLEQIRLDRFTEAEAVQFLEGHIGLGRDSPLGRAVLEDSDRFPERLDGYARYFGDHPDARSGERLPTEARDLTAGGLASGLLSRIPDPFLREVLLHAAPLRWFNAELLDRIEEVCVLTPPGQSTRAAALLDVGMRPSWVTNLGGGWGIDVETRRRALVDEFRRLHPGLHRRVNLLAAGYHLARLRELEGATAAVERPVDEASVFDYQPATHPTDRLGWPDYQSALGEWLYHLVALAPARGFARLCDYVGEALAFDHAAAAVALLDIGVELTLPASQSLGRQRLLEVARALQNDRHAETLQLLDEFSAAGSASTIADAAACFLVGTRLVLLGRSPLTVRENFQRAEKVLTTAVDGVQARSLGCLNLTWLARVTARRDEREDAALELLATAAERAAELDPRMTAEIKRTRGLILKDAARLDEARTACDEALGLLNRAGAAAEAADVLRLRAAVNLDADRRDAARRDLLRARSIQRQLVDPEAEAQVLLGLVEVALRNGDSAAAAEHERAIDLLRPADFLIANQIGILYGEAGDPARAVDHYTAALALSREGAILANRGRALRQWATTAAPGQGDALRRRAREDLAAAFDLDPDDLDTGIELAELARQVGDGAAAGATAEIVARRVVDAVHALPRPPVLAPADGVADAGDAPDRTLILRRLRDLLVRAVTLLPAESAVSVVAAWSAGEPADEELDLVAAIAGHELGAASREALLTALAAAERAVGSGQSPRGRALVELAALHAQVHQWPEAKAAAERAIQDQRVRFQAEYILGRFDQLHRREDEFGGEPEMLVETLVVDIAEDLRDWFDPQSPVGGEFFGWMLEAFRRARQDRVGLPPPGLWVGVRKELPPGTAQVLIDGVARERVSTAGDLLAAATPEDCRRRAGVDGRAAVRPWDGGPGTWLERPAAGALEAAGIEAWDPRGLVLSALDEALESSPRFLSAEEAAALSGENWDGLPAGEFLARAEAVRELLAARVPPSELPNVLPAYREAAEAARPAVLSEAAARLGVPRATPSALAAAFERTRFQPSPALGAPTGAAPAAVGVRLGTGDAEAGGPPPGPEVEEAGRRAVGVLCRALYVPEPALAVETDAGLPAGTIAVAVGEVTRLVARPADELDWWRGHATAGAGGRTRAAAAGSGVAGAVVRALEAVLWDDPGLLLPDLGRAQAVLSRALGGAPSERMTTALVEVLGRRVPLGPPETLKRACDRVLDRSNSGRVRLPAARTFRSAPRRPVPDDLPFGIRSGLAVDEPGRLRQLAVRVQIHHEAASHLRVSLTSPTGRTVVLHSRGEDDLARLRGGVDQDDLPGLAAFLNTRAEGDWVLHVQDLDASDAGLLEEWSLELTTTSSSPGGSAPTARPAIVLSYHERDWLTRCAGLERDLRRPGIEVDCGAELWAALEDGIPSGRLQRERVRLGTHLARELGLRFGHSIDFAAGGDLDAHEFRIRIHGLVRASGELRPGRYGQAAAAADGDLWIGPLSGVTHRRHPDDVPGGFDAPDRLMRHVRASVREAAAEFADADGVGAVLDRLAHAYPVTVPAVRSAAGDELLAAVLRELVTQGIDVADPQLMELIRELVRSADRAAECEELAAAPAGHLGRTAGAMAEWLRERLARADPDPDAPLVELGPVIETAIRSAVGSCDGRVPVYALAAAGDVLAALEDARRRLGGGRITVVTAAPLRRHVHRLIAAQFPAATVVARNELDPAVAREVVDLAAGAA